MLTSKTEEAAEVVPEVAPEAAEVVTESKEAAEVAEVLPEAVPRADKDREETFTCLRRPSPLYERPKFKSTTNE
jgi:hypothetical protein